MLHGDTFARTVLSGSGHDVQADDHLQLAPDEVRSYLDDAGFASVYLKARCRESLHESVTFSRCLNVYTVLSLPGHRVWNARDVSAGPTELGKTFCLGT